MYLAPYIHYIFSDGSTIQNQLYSTIAPRVNIRCVLWSLQSLDTFIDNQKNNAKPWKFVYTTASKHGLNLVSFQFIYTFGQLNPHLLISIIDNVKPSLA
jgi:hypothetical protein